MINVILKDLDKFYKGQIPAGQLFQKVPYFKIRPRHFDIHYKPRAKRFEIGFGRLRTYPSKDIENKLFLITHELCHIIQRDNFEENARLINLGLEYTWSLEEQFAIEREVLGFQKAIYRKMDWDISIFDRLRFGVAPGKVGIPNDLVDETVTLEQFETKLKEKLDCLKGKI